MIKKVEEELKKEEEKEEEEEEDEKEEDDWLSKGNSILLVFHGVRERWEEMSSEVEEVEVDVERWGGGRKGGGGGGGGRGKQKR
ncbi:hypothetical protein M0804_011616 [Polistes exclamans]|nr:hypothetical protein M0804_011616 [Polistes exclamans]